MKNQKAVDSYIGSIGEGSGIPGIVAAMWPMMSKEDIEYEND